MQRGILVAMGLASGLMLASCQNSTSDLSSRLQHNAQQTVREENPNPLDWQDIDQAQYMKIVGRRLKTAKGPAEFLPADHPLSLRVKFWMDALDQRLRQLYPTQLAPIPAPKAILWRNSSPNGFVSPVSTCVQVPVRFAKNVAADATRAPMVSINGKGLVYAVDPTQCLPSNAHVGAAEVAEYFKRNNGSCSVAVEGDTLVIGDDCIFAPRLTAGSAAGFAVVATGSMVTLTTAMASLPGTEDQFVGVIFHELGHYYRSHPAMWTEKYNFFYRQNLEGNAAAKPTRDESLSELGAQAEKYGVATEFFKIPGQQYHSVLFRPVIEKIVPQVASLCATSQCEKSCVALVSSVQDPRFQQMLGSFPKQKLQGPLLYAYSEFEKNLKICSSHLALAESSSENAAALVRSEVLDALSISVSPTQTLPFLQDALMAAHAAAQDQARAREELFRRTLDEKLGYYTFEQEADELAAEWLTLLGHDPAALIRKLFAVSELYQSQEVDNEFEFGFQHCADLYRAGWRDKAGNPVLVPVGNYGNPHHSRCYRAFNIDREIHAHGYHATGTAPAAPGLSWSELQKLARELSSLGTAQERLAAFSPDGEPPVLE